MMFSDPLAGGTTDNFRNVLAMHSIVQCYTVVSEHIYDVKTKRGVAIRVHLSNLYTLGMADYLKIRSVDKEINCIVVGSTWNSYTAEAKQQAVKDRIGLFDVPEFMGAIHYVRFWSYPISKRDNSAGSRSGTSA